MASRCQRCGSKRVVKGKACHDVVEYYCRNCGHSYSIYKERGR